MNETIDLKYLSLILDMHLFKVKSLAATHVSGLGIHRLNACLKPSFVM